MSTLSWILVPKFYLSKVSKPISKNIKKCWRSKAIWTVSETLSTLNLLRFYNISAWIYYFSLVVARIKTTCLQGIRKSISWKVMPCSICSLLRIYIFHNFVRISYWYLSLQISDEAKTCLHYDFAKCRMIVVAFQMDSSDWIEATIISWP